jgi:isocitrate/isopropylmalate dehydrogenase
VHTATGYTPNELFFGQFHERSMVPLVPFESESANVTEYHQKIRRFQEVAFQIARARNEKQIQTTKKSGTRPLEFTISRLEILS